MPDPDPKVAQQIRQPKSGGKPLSGREREVLGFLAEGLSGAAIAELLVLSPETVRTHVRNAMEKLGASTRSQAVALALESGAIGDAPVEERPNRPHPESPALGTPGFGTGSGPILTALLAGVVSLADVESGAIYFAEEGGMLLRLVAHSTGGGGPSSTPPRELTLGDGGIGRVALERRTRLIPASKPGAAPYLASPMTSDGRLVGVLALGIRSSRPTSRREALLIEAFGNRLAEIVTTDPDSTALRLALQRFKASWTETLDI
ncbi:MAG: LuxR C-terminal-related transcriptional regulator [Actinomycetota bacterium]|nr:LuxR C-terminal-related transcriptional regulator [Actinomycetota bacterium]